MDPVLIRTLAVAIAIFSGCRQDAERQTPPPLNVNTSNQKGPFEWSPKQKKEFLTNLNNVKSGDKLEDVVKLLGPPYSAEYYGPKESEDIKGILVKYHMKKIDSFGSNLIQDQDFDLFFDNDRTLSEVWTN